VRAAPTQGAGLGGLGILASTAWVQPESGTVTAAGRAHVAAHDGRIAHDSCGDQVSAERGEQIGHDLAVGVDGPDTSSHVGAALHREVVERGVDPVGIGADDAHRRTRHGPAHVVGIVTAA
jgi:hypothetical protein